MEKVKQLQLDVRWPFENRYQYYSFIIAFN